MNRSIITDEGPDIIMWHVYIVRCKDDTLYTGITNNLKRRLKEHNSGCGGRFTRIRRPVKLVYCEEALNRSDALKNEARIKKLGRKEKLVLIKSSGSIGANKKLKT